jgi:predicted RNase H-like HicB family nuclease
VNLIISELGSWNVELFIAPNNQEAEALLEHLTNWSTANKIKLTFEAPDQKLVYLFEQFDFIPQTKVSLVRESNQAQINRAAAELWIADAKQQISKDHRTQEEIDKDIFGDCDGKRLVYPIILTKVSDKHFSGYLVSIPDLNINTQGVNIADAIYMARDAIGMWASYEIDEGRQIPQPGSPDNLAVPAGSILALADIDIDAYRRALK